MGRISDRLYGKEQEEEEEQEEDWPVRAAGEEGRCSLVVVVGTMRMKFSLLLQQEDCWEERIL